MSEELKLYKEFIDKAVSLKDSAVSSWVRNGSFPETESNIKKNEMLSALSSDQKEVLAGLIEDAKRSGIHDLLALLNDTSEITYKDVVLPEEPFDTDLHYDFIARCEGDKWPL